MSMRGLCPLYTSSNPRGHSPQVHTWGSQEYFQSANLI